MTNTPQLENASGCHIKKTLLVFFFQMGVAVAAITDYGSCTPTVRQNAYEPRKRTLWWHFGEVIRGLFGEKEKEKDTAVNEITQIDALEKVPKCPLFTLFF